MGAKAMSSHGIGAGGGGPLSQQGSVCSLTFSEVDGQLSVAAADKRTVDEVWRDIQGACVCPRSQMTLEDFLSRAGAPADAAYTGGRSWAQQYQPAPAQLDHHQHYPMPRPLGVGAGPVLDALYHESHESGAAAGRKRAAGTEGGVVERSTVERRKKRMIKNRESAARSRARKQAYTNELENKISRLEEENERLRRHKAPEPVVQYVPQLEIKNQLRRTNSANF